jgi:ribosomal protein L37E
MNNNTNSGTDNGTYYGESACGLCDSENTVTRRSGGEFSYTVETLCEDCGFGSESRYSGDTSVPTRTRTFQYCL